MLIYWLFVSVFLLAEQYHKPTAVIVACIPGWLALVWCGWMTKWPSDQNAYYGVPNFVLDQCVKINAQLWKEAKWLILTFLLFAPISIYVLETS
jgi:hypothetical protein